MYKIIKYDGISGDKTTGYTIEHQLDTDIVVCLLDGSTSEIRQLLVDVGLIDDTVDIDVYKTVGSYPNTFDYEISELGTEEPICLFESIEYNYIK